MNVGNMHTIVLYISLCYNYIDSIMISLIMSKFKYFKFKTLNV